MSRSIRNGRNQAYSGGGAYRGGDTPAERLSDTIFERTRVQAHICVSGPSVRVGVNTLADYFLARAVLVERCGYDVKTIVRDDKWPTEQK